MSLEQFTLAGKKIKHFWTFAQFKELDRSWVLYFRWNNELLLFSVSCFIVIYLVRNFP